MKTLFILLISLISITTQAQESVYHVTATSLNLRTDSTLNAPIIAVLDQKELVRLYSKSRKWAHISTEHGSGFVARQYIAPGKPQNTIKAEQSTVLICVSSGAVAYHQSYCHGLKRCTHSVNRVTLQNAKSSGYRACKICY